MRIIESLFSFDSEMPIYIENEIIFSKHLINIHNSWILLEGNQKTWQESVE